MLSSQSIPFVEVIILFPEKDPDIATNKFNSLAYMTSAQLLSGAVCET